MHSNVEWPHCIYYSLSHVRWWLKNHKWITVNCSRSLTAETNHSALLTNSATSRFCAASTHDKDIWPQNTDKNDILWKIRALLSSKIKH
jgi:hypothetical protein